MDSIPATHDAQTPGTSRSEELVHKGRSGVEAPLRKRARRLSVATAVSFLAGRKARWLTLSLALLLASPSVMLDMTADDHFHALALQSEPAMGGVARAPWDVFSFAKNPEFNRELIEEGVFPWWSDPEVVISFMRPLSSLAHYLDHLLWPDSPVMMHLHNMAWFAALLLIVAALYRQLSPSPWVAGLSLLLFSIDDARAMTVGWISNRNALIALTPALAAVWAHHLWRTRGKGRYATLAAFSLLTGLSGSEAALQACGYLAAYALCMETASTLERVRSLLPYAGIVVVWRITYLVLGYGASGSGFYIDPGRDPLAFTQNLAQRLPVLLLAEFAMPFADLWDAYPVFAPALRIWIPILGVLALGLLIWLLKPLLATDPCTRFWLIGCVLATLPACSASPSDRLLTATGVGGAALIARLLANVSEKSYGTRSSQRKVLVAFLAIVHLALAPVLLPVRTGSVNVMEELIARAAASIPSGPEVVDMTVILLNPPAEPFAGYFPLYRQSKGIMRPKHFRWLATGITAMDVERVDEYSLKLLPEGGFLSSEVQFLLRSRGRPFHVSERIALDGLVIEIVAVTADGRPSEVIAHFDESLNSSKLRFMRWAEHGYLPFSIPPVGSRAHVPAVDMQRALLPSS